MNTVLDTSISRAYVWPRLNADQLAIFKRLQLFLIGFVTFILIIFMIFGGFAINQGFRLRITNSSLQWQVSSNNNILTPNNQLINALQDNYNKLVNDKATLTATLATQNTKLDETTKTLEIKNQELTKLTEENNKTRSENEAKAKELEQKNKDLESKANEVNGLNTVKNNLQNQKTSLESQKAVLERQKKELEKTIASGNFSQAKIPAKPIVQSAKAFVPPAPSNTFKNVSVIYFWFRTSGDYGSLCSGELNLARTTITTVTHCQKGAPKVPDNVIYRDIPVDSPDIFAVYVGNFNIDFNDNNYKIVTVDKGVVNASYYTRINSHCYSGTTQCNEVLLKTSQSLGEGNSGSTVYDPSGRFVGVLSGGYEEFRCPLISVGNLPPQSGDRSCSTSIIIALDGSYISYVQA